ncbi:MAG: dihydrolipoyl dehydrogenase [Muribaculaceae bacterium]|nr:dihydrolipoyl dehydrogenase [Muribaculaceae bacterium]
MTTNADLIVIGAGPGGYEIAAEQAYEGKNVIIIEKDMLGGTCLNRGCIPTKCLCAAAEMVDSISHSAQFGVTVTIDNKSYEKAHSRSVEIVDTLREGVRAQLSKCTIVEGEAKICADGTIEVGDQRFTAPKVIIATGSKPAVLPHLSNTMTSDDFLRLTQLPQRMVIIGGGVIGLEFAYIANAYTDVTVIEYCKEILPPFDSEIAKRLRLILAEKGINFITSAAVTAVEQTTEGTIVTYTDKKGQVQTVITDAVVTAVGRKAVLPEGLKEAGIEVNQRGFIATDSNMETTRRGFYAVGDCNGRTMLAHIATAQARKAMGQDINLDVYPSAVFVQPEVAMVGLTTEQCKEKGLDYRTKKALYRANGKAMASAHTDGFVKAIIDPATNKILGCHILGAHASDLIQEATLAMAQGLTVNQMSQQTIHGHPTLSEIMASAF